MARAASSRPSLKVLVPVYAALLALGTLALQWLDYLWLARSAPAEILLGVVALLFLVIGIAAGRRLSGGPPVPTAPGNPAAVDALGISPRELEVLRGLADGLSNKEIARALDVSPNTVKTHVARLFEKLEVNRRTEAIGRARELGLLP